MLTGSSVCIGQSLKQAEKQATPIRLGMEKEGVSLKVVNMPWLNRTNVPWLENTIGDIQSIFTIDNHFRYGALGDSLSDTSAEQSVLGFPGLPKQRTTP